MSATGRPAAGGAEGETAWYVYGVAPPDASPAIFDSVTGVLDGRVRLVGDDRVAAIVSAVPLAEFEGGALESNLADPAWVESGVRSHDAVLEAAIHAASVVPFRFGTIYRSEEQIRAMLADHPRLEAALDRIRDQMELGVKGFLAEPDPSETTDPEHSSGRRYLEAKQQARRAAEEREAFRARIAEEAHGRLGAFATDARANPLQPREVVGEGEEMFLNGAYLVPAAEEARFRGGVEALAAELASEGIRFEVTGPWPPYNFVDLDA